MIQEPIINFDPEPHIYTVDSRDGRGPRVVRSVTQRLEDFKISDWSNVPAELLWEAQQRGTMVHRAVHFINKNSLDLASVDERIGGYVEAYLAFKRDYDFRVRRSEFITYRRISIYGADAVVPNQTDLEIIGTIDAEGSTKKNADLLADVKTGDETDAWRPQTASYVRSLGRRAPFTHKRLIIQLSRGGKYKLIWYSMRDFDADWEKFRNPLIEAKRQELQNQ